MSPSTATVGERPDSRSRTDSSPIKTKLRRAIEGDGILDVFARYNFTVAEDEPAEREVAVDPEMLGKVFENLIEDDVRRAQGAYYTPREIVQFMCRESLRRHLTDEAARRKILASASELDEFIEAADLARETEELLGGNNPKDKNNKTPLPAKVRKCAAELDKICAKFVCVTLPSALAPLWWE